MLGCLEDKYFLNFSAWSREENNTNIINIPSIEDRLWGQSLSHLFPKLHLKILGRAGPNGDPIATPSICLQNLLLNLRNKSLVATVSKLRKIYLGVLGIFSSSLYKLSMKMSMVSFSGILVNKQSTSRLDKFALQLIV